MRKTRGSSTQVPWHSSDLCPVGKNFFESRRDRKPTTSEPETLDGGHACIPVEEPKTAPILSVFPALIVHSELKSVHPGFPVAFIFSCDM